MLSLLAGACASGRAAPSTIRAGVLPITSLDPLAATSLVHRQIFEGLVRYDPATLRPEPALAASWSASADVRTFTFRLRRARFHDGRAVTASDVVYSLTRLARAGCEAESASLLAPVVGAPEVCAGGQLIGVAARDTRTVAISLTEPWAELPSALGNPAAAIVPKDAPDAPAFGVRPVGTGPYRVVRPWDGRTLGLARFENHWSGRPPIPEVEFVGYADESSAYLDLVEGRLHYAPVPASRAMQARRQFGDEVSALGTGVYFFGFNLASHRVASPVFREGLSRAVDRDSLSSAVFKGTRAPALALLPPTLPGGDAGRCAPCEFDASAARALVARAHPDGAPEISIAVSDAGPNPRVAEALARMFAAAGVTARVVARPLREHLRGVQSGDADLFQLGVIPEYPSPDAVLWPLVRSGARDNYMRYSSPEVDRALAQARRTVDARTRWRSFAEAERRVVRDMPLLPLLWFRSSVALDPRLEAVGGGPVVDALGGTDFARVRFVR